jgi:putative metallohydrolase (TIGR04338 family)
MRDNQRQRVYDAERATPMWDKDRIDDIHALTKYVTKICKSAWFRRRFPTMGIVRVKDGRRCRKATGGWGTINMPRWSRTKIIVLHELSHAVQNAASPEPQAWHGREFCKIYLAFVKKWIGREAYDALKASFKEHGVKYVTGEVKV